MVELRLFGPGRLLGSTGEIGALTRQPKRMALLAYLTIATPRGFHRRDKLLGLFWPELDQQHARNSLSQALHVIRAALGENAVVTHGDEEVAIAPELVHSDVIDFDSLHAAGRYCEALELYHGDILDGFFVTGAPEFDRWLDGERARYRQRASDAAWSQARREAEKGDALAAGRRAQQAAALLPPDETQLRRLMLFLRDVGDRSAALRAYDEFARQFARDFELEPSTEAQALATSIRRDHGSVHGADSVVVPRDEPPPSAVPAAAINVQTTTKSWHPRFAVVAVALVLIIGISLALKVHSPASRGDATRSPRLVVFPFENLGAPENAYFAQGISDEIATRLTSMRNLRVVSGPAANSYRDARLAESRVAKEKSADYFLDGSASWLPSTAGQGHLRVRVQLVDGRNDRQMWGAVVDEDIRATSDAFVIFSNIAQRVVDELDIVLESPGEHPPTAFPTKSLEAYNDYLRGRDYLRRTSTKVNFAAAIENLEHAVALDTNFALGYAMLTNAHIESVWLGGMPRAHFDSAKVAGDRALEIDPNLPEAHTFLGHYYYACCEDYQRALWHLTKSNALRSGDYLVVMYIGNVQKRQGHFAEAINEYQQAARLDPLARWPHNNLGHAQMWSRKYDDAEKTFREVLASEPQDIFAYAHLAWLLVLRDGDTKAAWDIVRQAQEKSDGYGEMRLPYYLALLDRNYEAALATLTAPEPGLTASLLNEWLVDDEIRRALVFRLQNDPHAAAIQFDSARQELEAELRTTSPQSRRNQLWLRSGLAIAYAGLKRTDQARAQIQFVTAANPLKVDAIEGPKYLQHLALASALLNDRERAIAILQQLLLVGSPVSVQSLRLEPFWDPLRNDPRFIRMMATAR